MDECAAVYVKDVASATSVKGNLGEAAVKDALAAAGVPTPTTVSAPVTVQTTATPESTPISSSGLRANVGGKIAVILVFLVSALYNFVC